MSSGKTRANKALLHPQEDDSIPVTPTGWAWVTGTSWSQPMDIRSAYALLGLPLSATRDAVEARYRQLALLRHPDQGGDNRSMAELNRARETALAFLARSQLPR